MTSILFLIKTIYCNIFRWNHLRNKKLFLHFYCIFEILIKFCIFPKQRWPSQMIYLWTYRPHKTSLDNCLKSPVSEDPSTSNMVNGPKHCWNLNDTTFTIFIDPSEDKFRSKKSLWVICKILGLLFNPLTPDYRYSLLNRGNLLQHVQMQLSQKQTFFPFFFVNFPNLYSILNIFKKKDDPLSLCIFEITDSEKLGEVNV